ncbi:hypothetical protein [Alkalilimnicola sp. S0819]|uniref:hypothetical protein n=1 Tax=Alkalilimnicola sp. S0819 TaxID=2613922 RepID=UPI001261F728|nr:hypothetical protein [Alkalilimnicola sp. S0819]KAB7627869.1 hypothetical protein F3N43_02525 [Alkalilimnicola sp. S0819]MPQ15504.1 hypothetical protein [Alkalilimnicola sp. S0819]
MIRRLLYRWTARLRCRLITVDGEPYMERYFVGKPFGITVYLHRFVQGDGDRHVHDHPWTWSLGWVLAGGYEEERLTGFDPVRGWHQKVRRVRWWRPNFIGRRTFHRITEPHPETWTLFLHGRKVKGWGFLGPAEELLPGKQGVIYHQPLNVAASDGWRETGPLGAEAGRAPLDHGRSGALRSGA